MLKAKRGDFFSTATCSLTTDAAVFLIKGTGTKAAPVPRTC
jgi:hypothetical protein